MKKHRTFTDLLWVLSPLTYVASSGRKTFRALLLLWPFLLCRAPLQAESLPQFHERLTWAGSDRARFILEYWAESHTGKGRDIPTECVLRTRITRVLRGQKQVWEDQEAFRDPHWAQIDFAVAIRVQGQQAPQILVQRSRADWGDYVLYRVDAHGLKKTFSFSYREERCLRWVSNKGTLQQFSAIDRYETRNRPAERPGKRRQARLVYRYDRDKQIWLPGSTRWETYRFDDRNSALNSPVFRRPQDCPFRYARASSRPTLTARPHL